MGRAQTHFQRHHCRKGRTDGTVRTGAREPSKQWVPGTLNSFMVESTVAAAAAMAAARVTIVRCETIV